jgi:hypothetical protein
MFDPTSVLKDWGLTLGVLGLIAGISTLVLIFAAREFAFWFLRIDKILKNQEEILARIEKIEKPPKIDQTFPLVQPLPPEKENFQLMN